MLVALGLAKMAKSANIAAKETGLGQSRISRAVFVIETAPDQVELVLSGLPLRGKKGKASVSEGLSQTKPGKC
jgi:hypothetical protein